MKYARWHRLAFGWLLVCGCFSNPEDDTTPTVWELEFAASDDSGYGSLFESPPPSHLDVMQRLREASQAEHVKGLLLRVGPLGGTWATSLDITDALARIRKQGKPIHCHVEDTDNAGYALMSRACDRISVTPTGSLDLVGVRAQALYARQLLDSVGVKAELFQAGKFKGAADALTLDDMPETTRTSLNAILDALQGHLLGAMETGRSIARDRGQRLIDAGPYTAHAAHLEGLVDDVGFDDEAREHARKAAGVESVRPRRFGQAPKTGLAAILEALSSESEHAPKEPHAVLVTLEGTIRSSGRSSGASAETFVPKLRALADDAHCKAVVLRIDSPGGSALASDRMWHAVRRVAKKKPVIVSFGDMAASGGYYIASAGTHIMAPPVSLVGSIGVVGGKISLAGAADKLGVHAVTLQRGRNAGWSSPLSDLSESERTALRGMIDSTYRIFLRRVGQGRGLPGEAVAAMAEGRLMVASEALSGKLIDSHGGLLDAIERARSDAKLDASAPLVIWPRPQSPLQALLGAEVEARSPRRSIDGLLALIDPRQRFAALQTLLDGETAAAAAPYQLTIE